MKKFKVGKWLGSIFILALIVCGLELHSVYAGNNIQPITASNYVLQINGTPYAELEETPRLKDGDKINIKMDWKISNTDEATDTFQLDLSQVVTGIDIPDFSARDLTDDNGTVIGVYEIADSMMTITLKEDYVKANSERSGGATIIGEIATGLGKEQDNTVHPITIDTQSYDILFDAGLGTSSIGTWKATDGKAYVNDSGKLVQAYKLTIEGYVAKSTLSTVTDTFGSGLSNMSGITVASSTVNGITTGTTYTDMTALETALNGIAIDAGQKIELTYTMEVNSDIQLQTPTKKYNNKFSLTYKDNKNQEKTSEYECQTVNFTRPKITKTGTITEKTVTWTFTISMNDLNEADKELTEMVTSFVDDPVNGVTDLTAKNILNDITWTETSEGVFTGTYNMTITDEVANSASQITLQNDVTATINGNDYTASGTTKTEGRQWISKENVGANLETNTISWQITLDNIPSNVTNFTLKDSPDWQHSLSNTFYITDNNHSTPYMVVHAGTVVTDNGIVTSYNNGTLTFADTYMASQAGNDVVVTYSTTYEGSPNGKEFKNSATISYKDPAGDGTQSSESSWKKKNALTKKGTADTKKNSINYEVTVDLSKVGTIEEGKNIVLTDTLPEGLILDGAASIYMYKVHSSGWWQEWKDSSITVNTSTTDNVVTFTVPLTSSLIADINSAVTETGNQPLIVVNYVGKVKNEKAFTANGTAKEFTNSVVGTYNDETIGDYETTTSLTPKNAVTKKATYTKESAPYADYEILVNPLALDLSDGDLIATDKMGNALSYMTNSVKVYKYEEEDWIELTKDTDYSFIFDEMENSLTFTLPDSAYLKITYQAKVKLYVSNDESKNGEFTKENSTNKFTLDGFSSSTTESTTQHSGSAFTPMVWAEGTTTNLKLYKYWMDGTTQTALDGCTFKLVKCTYDSENQKMIDCEVVKENITTTNGESTLSGLLYDQYYALYETSATTGFECATKPYYFVIPGSSNLSIPDGVEGTSHYGDTTIYFENKKGNGSTPTATPTVAPTPTTTPIVTLAPTTKPTIEPTKKPKATKKPKKDTKKKTSSKKKKDSLDTTNLDENGIPTDSRYTNDKNRNSDDDPATGDGKYYFLDICLALFLLSGCAILVMIRKNKKA